MNTTITKRVKYWAACALMALATVANSETLPFYNSEDFTPNWLETNSPELENFHQIPAFSFVDQNGNRVTDRTFQDKIYVAGFFFSTCPGICPTIRSKLSKVQDRFLGYSDIRILQHSIQPSVDTVDVLHEYATRNEIDGEFWHLVTGDRDAIYTLAKSAYFASDDLGNEQNANDFLHTESLLLIDQNRHIRGIYNGLNSTSVGYLIQDIETLIAEKEAQLACH